MLLAASSHSKDNPDVYSALSTIPAEAFAPSTTAVPAQPKGEDVIFTPPAAHGKAPAHSLHTPQQLAQLEAITRTQSREKPESTLVSDEEKYLAAQLAHLASQHHGSEYNRQKPNSPQGGTSVYIPLSIQLPIHISELRMRQAQSSRRQAWFIATPKDESNDSVENDSRLPKGLEEQQDYRVPQLTLSPGQIHGTGIPEAGQNERATQSLSDELTLSQRSERTSYLQPELVEVELLRDALGNSLFPMSRVASVSTEESTKLSPTALPLLPTRLASRVALSSLDPDVVETTPLLAKTTLPQFPSPVRSRTPSQNMLVRPANLPNALPPSPLNGWSSVPDSREELLMTTKSGSLLVPNERPALWPLPPAHPAPVYVAPTPCLQLQLALETAISKDMIPDANQFPSTHTIEQHSMEILNPSSAIPPIDAPHNFYGVPAYGRSPGVGTRPLMLMSPGLAVPKTSETHPINISQVIPPEYIATISEHLEKHPTDNGKFNFESERPVGSYFRIAPSLRLDRVIYILTVRALEARAAMARYSPVPVRVRFADGTSAAGPALFVGPGVCASASEPKFDRPPKRPLTMTPPQPFTKISNAKMTETPPNNRPQNYYNYPNTLSLNLQGSSTSVLNGPSTGRRLVQSFPGIPSDAAEANSEDLTNGSAAGEVQRLSAKPPISIALPIIPPLPHFVSSPPSATSQHTPMASFESLPNPQTPPGIWMVDQPKNGIVIGNLYLSSCPGKKVRLNGPIKGRGAICRDLGADLARVKSNGVYLIICCLDDDEMEFLGAPWSEYREIADTVGLDVLRLPMPEGLCPLSVQTMSQHMDQIIRNYTLKGRHVLVHCRGGVGRAGLVACTWMLKLGICGSVEPNSNGRRTIQDPSIQIPAEDLMQDKRVASDSLELLERVVYIIRRQRSVKAIETYEQVRFLLEFIEYLRDTDAQALGA